MTTTSLDHFEPDFLEQAVLFRVNQGRIEPFSSQSAEPELSLLLYLMTSAKLLILA